MDDSQAEKNVFESADPAGGSLRLPFEPVGTSRCRGTRPLEVPVERDATSTRRRRDDHNGFLSRFVAHNLKVALVCSVPDEKNPHSICQQSCCP